MGKAESMCRCGGGRTRGMAGREEVEVGTDEDLGEIGRRRQRDQKENGASRHLDSIARVTWVGDGHEVNRVEGT